MWLHVVFIALDIADEEIVGAAVGVVAILRVTVSAAILFASIEVVVGDRRITSLWLAGKDGAVHCAACGTTITPARVTRAIVRVVIWAGDTAGAVTTHCHHFLSRSACAKI